MYEQDDGLGCMLWLILGIGLIIGIGMGCLLMWILK